MQGKQPTQSSSSTWTTLVLVSIVSLVVGLVVIPRLGKPTLSAEATPAPDFTLEVIHGGDDGNRLRLSDLQGKVVLLDFWASWCGPCAQQVPALNRVAEEYASRGVEVVGVNTDDKREPAQAFLRARNVSYVAVEDTRGAVASAYRVKGLPTLVLIDAQGQIRARHTRVMSENSLNDMLEAVLSEANASSPAISSGP